MVDRLPPLLDDHLDARVVGLDDQLARVRPDAIDARAKQPPPRPAGPEPPRSGGQRPPPGLAPAGPHSSADREGRRVGPRRGEPRGSRIAGPGRPPAHRSRRARRRPSGPPRRGRQGLGHLGGRLEPSAGSLAIILATTPPAPEARRSDAAQRARASSRRAPGASGQAAVRGTAARRSAGSRACSPGCRCRPGCRRVRVVELCSGAM